MTPKSQLFNILTTSGAGITATPITFSDEISRKWFEKNVKKPRTSKQPTGSGKDTSCDVPTALYTPASGPPAQWATPVPGGYIVAHQQPAPGWSPIPVHGYQAPPYAAPPSWGYAPRYQQAMSPPPYQHFQGPGSYENYPAFTGASVSRPDAATAHDMKSPASDMSQSSKGQDHMSIDTHLAATSRHDTPQPSSAAIAESSEDLTIDPMLDLVSLSPLSSPTSPTSPHRDTHIYNSISQQLSGHTDRNNDHDHNHDHNHNLERDHNHERGNSRSSSLSPSPPPQPTQFQHIMPPKLKRKRGRPRKEDRALMNSGPARLLPRTTRQPHNEVEKKYREGLNSNLEELRDVVGDLPQDRVARSKVSKGQVLAGAVREIKRLQEQGRDLERQVEYWRRRCESQTHGQMGHPGHMGGVMGMGMGIGVQQQGGGERPGDGVGVGA